MMDKDTIARHCLRGVRGAITDDQYIDALERITTALQDAFDLGWKFSNEAAECLLPSPLPLKDHQP